jgi:hypothetical protein
MHIRLVRKEGRWDPGESVGRIPDMRMREEYPMIVF